MKRTEKNKDLDQPLATWAETGLAGRENEVKLLKEGRRVRILLSNSFETQEIRVKAEEASVLKSYLTMQIGISVEDFHMKEKKCKDIERFNYVEKKIDA